MTVKKARKVTIGKTRAGSDKRLFPKQGEKMTTLAYVQAYHQANANVHLTTVEYVGG